MALSRLPRTSRFTHGVTSLKHEPSLFQSSSFLPFLFLLLSSLATPNTTSIRPLLSFDVSEATSVWQLHEIRGWNSLDAHCPVAAAFEAEPVTIDERRGLEVTSARLSFNLRELQLPPTIAHHRVALRTRPPPPPPVVHPRSTIAASTHEHPFYFCTVQPTPSSLSPRPDGGTDLSSRVKLVERANARHELNSISIIGRALHNREVLIPIPATTDSRHSRPAIERHGLHLHDPHRPI